MVVPEIVEIKQVRYVIAQIYFSKRVFRLSQKKDFETNPNGIPKLRRWSCESGWEVWSDLCLLLQT